MAAGNPMVLAMDGNPYDGMVTSKGQFLRDRSALTEFIPLSG